MANRYFCRFTNVIIRNSSDIRSCNVRFRAYDQQLTDEMRLNCYFVDADNPDAPADKTELDAFSLTAGVAWDNLPAWYDGIEYQTPDLSDILEAVIGRAGWESGNAVILIIEDDGSPSDVHRKISAFEYLGQTERPSLNVGWYSSWETFFDNTRWQAMQLDPSTVIETAWDSINNWWDFNIDPTSNGGRLEVKGTWHRNYQPKEMIIRHTHSGTPELKVYAADGIIHHSLGYTSGTVITPLWAGRSEGIYRFEFLLPAGDDTPFAVTDIVFNSEAPAAQTTTSTSSTASTTSSSSSTASTTSTISTTSSTASTMSTSSTMSTTSSTSSTASSTSTQSSTSSSSSTATTRSTHTTFSTSSTTTTSHSTTSTQSTQSTTSSSSSTASTLSTTSTSSTTSSTASSTSTSSTASTISTTSSTMTSTSSSSSTTTTTA